MADQEPKSSRSRNDRAAETAIYPNRSNTTDNTARFTRNGSEIDIDISDEILERSLLVVSLRSELRAAHKHITTLNSKISDERKALLSEAELSEKRLSEREKILAATLSRREEELRARMSSIESAAEAREREGFAQRAKFDAFQAERTAELQASRAELDERIATFESEQIKYQEEYQKKLQSNSKNFVSGMVQDLGKKSSSLSTISLVWSILGGLVLIFATVMLSWVTYLSVVYAGAEMSWPLFALYALKGGVLVGVAGVASRYAFVMSSNYMKESLRTADRVHAIRFGQFYVETYGAAASWEQVRETFSNWNGEGKSAWENISDREHFKVSQVTDIVNSIVEKSKA